MFRVLNKTSEAALRLRDPLLEELRALGQTFPQDAAVRKELAKGLFNTLNDAKKGY